MTEDRHAALTDEFLAARADTARLIAAVLSGQPIDAQAIAQKSGRRARWAWAAGVRVLSADLALAATEASPDTQLHCLRLLFESRALVPEFATVPEAESISTDWAAAKLLSFLSIEMPSRRALAADQPCDAPWLSAIEYAQQTYARSLPCIDASAEGTFQMVALTRGLMFFLLTGRFVAASRLLRWIAVESPASAPDGHVCAATRYLGTLPSSNPEVCLNLLIARRAALWI